MDNKKLAALGTIQRALGMIEGATVGCSDAVVQTLIDAIQMIDQSMEVLIHE